MAKEDHIDLMGDWADLKPGASPKTPKPAGHKGGVLDINELREATQRAIQEGKSKRLQAEMSRVEKILQQATEKARKEAVKGKNSCRVMKLMWDKDFTYTGAKMGAAGEVRLNGVAKLVYDRLIAAEIEVSSEVIGYAHHFGTSCEERWLIIKW